MCDFISWIEKDGHVLFLTDREIFSPRGRELFGAASPEDYDVIGHGAIRRYYAPPGEELLSGGADREIRDFWNVGKLPKEIRALHPEDPQSFLRHWGRAWDAGSFQYDDLGYLLENAPKAWNSAMYDRAPKEIDLDADPRIPYEGWSVANHRKGGKLVWTPDAARLHLADGQRGGAMSGFELRKELLDLPAMNANALDHLLRWPHLIPEEWKGKRVFFWATEYRDRNGRPLVCFLFWLGVWSYRGYHWLDDEWGSRCPAAVAAS